MTIPSCVTPSMQAVIEDEYPRSTDTSALAARLGITLNTLYQAARAMRVRRDPDAVSQVMRRHARKM